MIKLGSSSLIIRNKKSGQSMHALTKTRVSEASLTNLHNSQLLRKCYVVATRSVKTLTLAIFKWLFHPTLHLPVSLSCLITW